MKLQSKKKKRNHSKTSKIIKNHEQTQPNKVQTKTKETTKMKNNYSYKNTFSELPEVQYAIEPDWELLLDILKVRRHSHSPVQDQFVDELQAFFGEKGALTSRDAYGNLYVTKGEADQYRCMVAHTDINQAKRANVRIYMNKEWIFGFDMEEGCQCGLGADDGVGIAMAIEMFNRFDTIKLFFPKDEETGMNGSNAADTTFFSNCTMILQPDRRSFTNDLVTFTNGIEVCSQEFVDAAAEISLKYGYAAARGIATDVGALKRSSNVNCIACNVSCGYAFEHSDKEVISRNHYRNAMNYIHDLLVGLGGVKWEHVYVAPVYKAPVPTPARQTTIYDENFYEDYYMSRYGENYWDGFPQKEAKKESKVVEFTPKNSNPFDRVKATDTNIVDEEEELMDVDEWYAEMYPQYIEEKNRAELKHYKCDDVYLTSSLPNQSTIDAMISDGTCPCCRNDIRPDNFLYLNTFCEDCFSVFNVPPDDFQALYRAQEQL